jgi:hypothetical protein
MTGVDIDYTTVDLSGVEHRPCKIRGVLTFWHLPAIIQNAEDSSQWRDQKHAHTYQRRLIGRRRYATRPATPAERALLLHLGYQLPTDHLTTYITWMGAVRRRFWPQLPGSLNGLDPQP